MGFFNWAAPAICRYGGRFTAADVEAIASHLRPAVGPGARVLDVGGAAGGLAVLLADAFGARVTVVDPTPQLLGRVPAHPLVDTLAAAAEAIPLDDHTADAVVVTDSFHHFRDQAAAVREFARVVRPGGRVAVFELDPRRWPMPLIAFAERLVGEPAAFMTPSELCAYMAERGIAGECAGERGASYRFVGTVGR